MTDSTPADGQDPNADAGQDPTSHGAGEQDSQPTGFDALPAETQKEIRALRNENAKARKRIEEYENAGKTELEKRDAAVKAAEDRALSLEKRLRDQSARSAVTDAAAKANAISTSAVYALIRDGLEYDDEGEPTNVPALIAQARKDEPALFRAANGSGDGGRGAANGNVGNVNDLFREMAKQAT